MSRPAFQHTHTAYLIDDRLYQPIPYPEASLQAAQRLSKTWAFKTRVQSGIVFPRVPAGYAWEQVNPDVGPSRFADWSDDKIAALLPFTPALKLYAVATHHPGHLHPLQEPILEILEKPAGAAVLRHAESFTLREFLEIQREQDPSIGILYGVRRGRAEFGFIHGDNLMAAASVAKAQELRCAEDLQGMQIAHEEAMEAEQAAVLLPF